MTERELFMEALDRGSPADRAAYLDATCGGDPALRERVEALLHSHEEAGKFLAGSAPERLAGAQPGCAGDDTRSGPSAPDGDLPLDFLEPSDKAGSIGRLGHYEVQEVVGQGGMGVVLKAFDESLHRVVAIKVMAPQLASSATARKRFVREARAQAAVTHDHVVTIHAVEESGPLPNIVMQFVAGQSLQDRLDRTGPLPLPEILRIGMQTAAGLAAAHAQGLVHRDVKPANILLENGVERVKLTDFGLARAADDASLTQSGTIAGTPSFMSPEQAEGKAVDHRSDLFSLGSVLYAMCTGRPPFRASTSMGVLKRVCEETPRPVREANPEIPDWLDALIEKLHAKDPAARFQSAAEVAELLGRQLAKVQHPSMVPPSSLSPLGRGVGGEGRPFERPHRGHRWAVAAAVLVATLAVLGTTEATGVTNVRATVIRIFTPEGTLVVETDDPAVKVTVEGDGDLVITGAGPQEVRLRAGSYRLHAVKDGKPVKLDRDLVAISRGDRQIVRVCLEGEPSAVAPTVERGAFVVLGGNVVPERKFDTLAEAVQGASAGGTIEIRGNGPFVTEPVNVHLHTLTIRSGDSYRPVIRLSAQACRAFQPFLWASGNALTLEGIEFQRLGQKEWAAGQKEPSIVYSEESALYIANCRFRLEGSPLCICVHCHAAVCVVCNCEFLGPDSRGGHSVTGGIAGQLRVLENCVHVGNKVLNVPHGTPIRLTRNTLVSSGHLFFLHVQFPPKVLKEMGAVGPIRVEASGNVFDVPAVLLYQHNPASTADGVTGPADAEAMLLQLLSWQDRENVYREGSTAVPWCVASLMPRAVLPRGDKSAAAWKKFWNVPGAELSEGPIRYQGGNLLAKLAATPEQLTPEDFRLRADSAGYRAGKDGKDLGADVDLVGPGPAYERWKKTPEYQQWLKNTGQLRAEALKSEPGAFVRLGGKGVAERKFDTLSEAVQAASDGDTIEVRGNGPFVSDGVTIRHPLVIRAGAGFTPSITLSQPSADANIPLLRASESVVLEGLELRRIGAAAVNVGDQVPRLIQAKHEGSLHITNCRLIYNSMTSGRSAGITIGADVGALTLRNCELSGDVQSGCSWFCKSDSRYNIENCAVAVGGIGIGQADPALTNVSIRVRGNTFCRRRYGSESVEQTRLTRQGCGSATPPARLLRKRGALRTRVPRRGALLFHQYYDDPLPAAQAEAILPRLIDLAEQQNVYQAGTPMLRLLAKWKPLAGARGQDHADWDRFWGQMDTGSVVGEIRFVGGDLVTRALTAPEKLTAEDFRLRPDSAGYKAGKDGKDLGADVDLVGPGKAYERWKITPEYQQWLKDTKQLTATASRPEPNAFVVLGGKGVAERQFDTLAAAVQGASDGDTIEIRGNGPFDTRMVDLHGCSLIIRAGDGVRPVIRLREGGADEALLRTDRALVLEGLDLRLPALDGRTDGKVRAVVWSVGAPFFAANCRFFAPREYGATLRASPLCVARNCLFVSQGVGGTAIHAHQVKGGRGIADNCILAAPVGWAHSYIPEPAIGAVSVTLRSCTILNRGYGMWLGLWDLPEPPGDPKAARPVRLEASASVFDVRAVFNCEQSFAKPLPTPEAAHLLQRLFDWHERGNLYAPGGCSLTWSIGGKAQPPHGPTTLAGWKAFWKSGESGSLEGRVRYQGGALLAKMATAPEELTPVDFRLRPDSAGYKAGEDSKDLGADVDLVGPGKAYERWKITPEYQQWLKDTGQVKK